MHQAAAVPAWVLIAYLVSGICFILALRGLSSPATSQRGNQLGMIGMGIAVATTLAVHDVASLPEIGIAIAIGAVIGIVLKLRSGLREGGYVPFGPFLAAAGVTAMVVGPQSMLRSVGL